MNKHRIAKVKPEVIDGVARDTGHSVEDIRLMMEGKVLMTFDVTAALVDRDSGLSFQDFSR